MNDWRTILKAPPQTTQNSQNGWVKGDSEYFEDIEPGKCISPSAMAVPAERVRPVEEGSVAIEPATTNAKGIYWETVDGRILGPAVPEFLARDGDTFLIVTTFEGQIRWINSDRLRSAKAFRNQLPVREVEPIRTGT